MELSNTVNVLGNYNSIPTSLESEAVVVSMIDGLTVTKEADKMVWASGVLTYTITINNAATENYTSPVITDVLNPSLVTFVSGSVMLNNEKLEESNYTYEASSGTLTINLPDITSSSKSEITFQVTKKS